MKVVVLGASGNIGTALLMRLRALGGHEVVAVARRVPDQGSRSDGVSWRACDVRSHDLVEVLRGADAVVNLTWLFHPSHDADSTWQSNVGGTARILDAVQETGVRNLIHASSIAAYSPAADEAPIDESWPTGGASSAAYAREKAYIERLLDIFERDVDSCRVVRLRPAFVFHRRAATQQRRLFAGPFVPGRLVRPGLVPVLPYPKGLSVQTIHADDVASAIALALEADYRGALNLCADEALGAEDVGDLFEARSVSVAPPVIKGVLRAGWLLHAVPADPHLFDALLRLPIMSTATAKSALGWKPGVSASDALAEFLSGLRAGAGGHTPPLDPRTSGVLRSHEFKTGVGAGE